MSSYLSYNRLVTYPVAPERSMPYSAYQDAITARNRSIDRTLITPHAKKYSLESEYLYTDNVFPMSREAAVVARRPHFGILPKLPVAQPVSILHQRPRFRHHDLMMEDEKLAHRESHSALRHSEQQMRDIRNGIAMSRTRLDNLTSKLKAVSFDDFGSNEKEDEPLPPLTLYSSYDRDKLKSKSRSRDRFSAPRPKMEAKDFEDLNDPSRIISSGLHERRLKQRARMEEMSQDFDLDATKPTVRDTGGGRFRTLF